MSSTPVSIYGFHEPGGEHLFGTDRGWIVFTHTLGHDPNNTSGFDYRPWSEQSIGCIARLNHGYGEAGTIPPAGQRGDGAARLAQFVAHSSGCTRWIIGNEPNHSQEWPGGVPISSGKYAEYFVQCMQAIHGVGGHLDDEFMPAPVAPWNAESGVSWLSYWQDVLYILDGHAMPNAIALHAYSRGMDPSAITATTKMDPPYQKWFNGFQHFKQLLEIIPTWQRNVPVYITEFNAIPGWDNRNTGLVREAYREIDTWNQGHPDQVVRALCLYRWPLVHDQPQWSIVDRPEIQDDFVGAVAQGYRWTQDTSEPPPPPNGDDMTEQWLQVYLNACERGFYDQDGASEITIPVGTELFWIEDPTAKGILDRPEMDLKDVSFHSEVYEGRFSGSGMFQDTTGRLFLVTDPIYVQNSRPVRGSCMYMQELRGTQGGGRLGILNGSGLFGGQHECPPSLDEDFAETVTWGDWYNWQEPEKVWAELTTPQLVPTQGFVRLVLRFNLDYARWGGFCYDVLRVEQLVGSGGNGGNGGSEADYDRIRQIVRAELDATRLTG